MITVSFATKPPAVRIVELLLLVTGILLSFLGVVTIPLAFAVSRGGRSDLIERLSFNLFWLMLGIGFLLPRLWTKFLAAVLLAGWGAELLASDSYVRQDWWIYVLLFIPLVAAIWLLMKTRASSPRRLKNGD
jgi:hypothetical protein